MACMPGVAAPATAPLVVSPRSLLAAFALVPDPRRQASIEYALPALLALAVTAILANQHSPLAIAQWAARQGAAVLAPLGFAPGRTCLGSYIDGSSGAAVRALCWQRR